MLNCAIRMQETSNISIPFVIRDPLWGDIELDRAELQVLDSDIFQRLRGIKHMGTTLLVYPSAVQTRFVHSLGNMHLIGDIVDRALRKSGVTAKDFLNLARDWLQLGEVVDTLEVRSQVVRVTRLAGMCHDLGHFPMSHVVEEALSDPKVLAKVLDPREHQEFEKLQTYPVHRMSLHEFATLRLIELNCCSQQPMLAAEYDWLRKAAIDVIWATHGHVKHPVAQALAELVSGEIDADRAEYLRRDGYVSGAGYGRYDLERLLDSFVLVRDGSGFRFRPSSRAL